MPVYSYEQMDRVLALLALAAWVLAQVPVLHCEHDGRHSATALFFADAHTCCGSHEVPAAGPRSHDQGHHHHDHAHHGHDHDPVPVEHACQHAVVQPLLVLGAGPVALPPQVALHAALPAPLPGALRPLHLPREARAGEDADPPHACGGCTRPDRLLI